MKREHAYKLRDMMHKAAVSLSDTDALSAVELFPAWASGIWYETGGRYRYGERLYRVRISHTSQEGWEPPNVPALWEEVEQPGQGDTPDNTIPYYNNMALVQGKYYSQYDIVYVCTRDTVNPVYADLADLVGLYVEVYVG